MRMNVHNISHTKLVLNLYAKVNQEIKSLKFKEKLEIKECNLARKAFKLVKKTHNKIKQMKVNNKSNRQTVRLFQSINC